MTRKLVAIVLALLINCAAFAWVHTWSAPVAAGAVSMQRTAGQSTLAPTTLAPITVRPTQAQIELLRREGRSGAANRPETPHGSGAWGG